MGKHSQERTVLNTDVSQPNTWIVREQTETKPLTGVINSIPTFYECLKLIFPTLKFSKDRSFCSRNDISLSSMEISFNPCMQMNSLIYRHLSTSASEKSLLFTFVSHCLHICRDTNKRGLHLTTLHVRMGNDAAQRSYEKFGCSHYLNDIVYLQWG